MSSLSPKLLFIGNLQFGNAYTAPTSQGSYAIIKSINVCNTSNEGKSFSINLVTPGGSVGNQSLVVGNVALSGGNVFSYETSIVMPAGSFINVSQPDNSLTFTISGVEYVI
jgi:hypothetical protein